METLHSEHIVGLDVANEDLLVPEAMSVIDALTVIDNFFQVFRTAPENFGTGVSLRVAVPQYIDQHVPELRLALMTFYTNGSIFPPELLPKIDAYIKTLLKKAKDIVKYDLYKTDRGYVPLNQEQLLSELTQALS